MVTSSIGRIFLDEFNKQQQDEGLQIYTAKKFFEEVYFPLFYDHEKYMQWVINSPFVQNIKKEITNGVKGKLKMPDSKSRKDRLDMLSQKIDSKARLGTLDGSVAIGFRASKLTDNASGQVSNIKLPFDSEDAYMSWIGSGLGIGVKGKLVIFFYHPQVLMHLFEGWKIYRNEYLNHPLYIKGLVPNQIDDWNAQWLSHVLNDERNLQFPLFNFSPIEKSEKSNVLFVKNQSWFTILYRIANSFPNQELNTYVCSFGKTNKSFGFIPIELPAFRSLKKFYRLVLGLNFINAPKFLDIYKVEDDDYFIRACENGKIGLDSLVPKDLRSYYNNSTKLKSINLNKKENIYKFYTFKTWLLAMLNKEEMLEFSSNVAQSLLEYVSKEKDGRSKRDSEIKNLFNSNNKNDLLKNLEIILEKSSPKIGEILKKLRDEIHFISITNEWQYLILLIRFDFIFQQNQSINQP